MYQALHQPADAIKWITKATELDPSSAAAFANLGVALDEQGQYAKAESAYRRSLELDSTQATTLFNLGSNLVLQGKPAEAASAFEQVLKTSDSAVVRKRYGDALTLLKQFDTAIDQYRLALKANPRYAPAMNELGRVLILQYKQGLELDEAKRRDALAMWKQSLEINPTQPEVEAMVKQWETSGSLNQP